MPQTKSRTAVFMTLVLVAAPAVLVAQDEKSKDGLKNLEGTWVAQSREYEGKLETKDDLKGLTLDISGEKFAFKSDGDQAGLKGTLAVDPSVTPKSVDVKEAGKDGKETVLRGIYELDGDTLKVAMPQSGGDRPKDFTTKVGSNVRVTVYQRSKTKAAPDVARTFGEGFTRHTATVDKMKIHYVVGGKGDPVLLLHGWPQTSHSWRKVAPAIAAKGYTVICPDLPGLGDSGQVADAYTKKDAARHLRTLVQQLGHKDIYLVGTDWGGNVAYHYAAQYPDEVRRVAIMETTFAGFGAEELTDITEPERIWHFHFHMVPELPEKVLAGRERVYLTWFYHSYNSDPSSIGEADIDEYVRCYSAPGAMRSGFAYYRTIPQDRKDNQEAAKTKLKMPVLTVGGDKCLGDHIAKALPKLAENTRGVVLKDCGHQLAEERPTELTRELLKFFADGP